MDSTRVGDVLLEQIGNQDRVVAFRTMTTESKRPAEQPAGFTAALADGAVTARRTLVERVGSQSSRPLKLVVEIGLTRG